MKQNKIQIPEGYKNSALGIIPNDWEVKRLGEVAKLSSGGTPLREKKEYWDGDIPWITTTLLNYPKIYSAEEFITKEGLQNSATKLLPKNTILMAMYGQGQTRGKVSMLMINATTNQACAAFCNLTLDNEFFYYFLDSKYIEIRRQSNDGGQKNLSLELIKSLKISIPPLPQQQKIAEILGTWDEAIEKQSKLIDKLTDRKRGLMQQLLTGKKRLAGFSEEWKEVRLGEIGERVVRKNTEKNHNVVTISAQQGFVSQKDYFNKTIASEVTDNYYLIHKDEFCYNKSYSAGYPMGAIKRLKTFDKAVVTTLYICFKLKENISKDFFEQFTEGGNLINSLVKVANEGGRAHGLLNVTPVDFFNIKFTLPSLSEQTAIANILTAADKEIELAKSKLELLRSQKNGLMQELLTGKTRVKIDSHKI